MIWHIFRKDARLLWPFALTLAIAQAAGAALVLALGHFREPRELAIVASVYPYLVFLGIIVLTIAVVHQDPLSGVRQDWLTRPVRRRDLLLAKAVFALLMIHAPIFFIDVLEQLVSGFSLAASMAAAAFRGVGLLCVLTLPALLLAAVTASLIEALLFGLIASIGCTIIYLAVFVFVLKPPELPSGIFWVATSSGGLVIVIGAALTLAFAYSRRQLLSARLMGVVVVLAALGISGWLPFGPAFAVQQRLTRTSIEQQGIDIRFDVAPKPIEREGRSASVVFDGTAFRAAAAADNVWSQPSNSSHSIALVRLPLQIASLPPNSILLADQVSVRLTGSDGATLYQGVGVCERLGNGSGRACRSNALEVRENGHGGSGTHVEQQLNIPAAVYAKLKDRPLRLELDYALTLLKKAPAQTMGTTGDKRLLPGLGSCATRIDADGDEVELRCLSITAAPSCATAVLDDPQSGLRNPELHLCLPNYAPFPQSRVADVMNPVGLSLAFRDPSGLAKYPVDGRRIQSAHISLITYYPTDHFRRALVVPEIRLADWAAH